jgi:hypothetical protein
MFPAFFIATAACLFCISLSLVSAQIPCDALYGEHCPDESSWGVGDCLKKLSNDLLDKSCADFVALHDACKSDIDLHCNGKEYTGDLFVCLSEWTKPEQLSELCIKSLPAKEVKERVLSDKEKKKAAARRKIRKDAEKLARKGKEL